MADEPQLYPLLRCPQTRQRLLSITSSWVDRINARIHAGELETTGGETVRELIEGGLITEDDRFLYPVRDGVVDLLVADCIVLSGADH